ELSGPVQRAAIVPDQEVARTPLVAVDVLALRRERVQLLEQRAAFVLRPADDVGRVRADVKALAAILARAHDRMVNGRHQTAHLVRDLLEARLAARVPQVVLRLEALYSPLHVRRQIVVDAPGVDAL